MFLPTSTELAPDRLPIGTLALMFLNALVFPFFYTELAVDLALEHGVFAPWQWLTSPFLHAGPLHLCGNLLFLWPFGLVVESFLGWRAFLALYFAIAIGQSALEQILSLFADTHGYSAGASSAIYGLMAIAMLWAPRSEVTVMMWFWFAVRFFDVEIFWFSGLRIFWDFFLAANEEFALSTPYLHVQGVLVGGIIGLILLRAKLVDTGGMDLPSLWMHGTPRERRLRAAADARRRREAKTAAPPPITADVSKLHRWAQELLEAAYFGGAAHAAARYVTLVQREASSVAVALREAALEKLAFDPAMRRAFEEALDAARPTNRS